MRGHLDAHARERAVWPAAVRLAEAQAGEPHHAACREQGRAHTPCSTLLHCSDVQKLAPSSVPRSMSNTAGVRRKLRPRAHTTHHTPRARTHDHPSTHPPSRTRHPRHPHTTLLPSGTSLPRSGESTRRRGAEVRMARAAARRGGAPSECFVRPLLVLLRIQDDLRRPTAARVGRAAARMEHARGGREGRARHREWRQAWLTR